MVIKGRNRSENFGSEWLERFGGIPWYFGWIWSHRGLWFLLLSGVMSTFESFASLRFVCCASTQTLSPHDLVGYVRVVTKRLYLAEIAAWSATTQPSVAATCGSHFGYGNILHSSQMLGPCQVLQPSKKAQRRQGVPIIIMNKNTAYNPS